MKTRFIELDEILSIKLNEVEFAICSPYSYSYLIVDEEGRDVLFKAITQEDLVLLEKIGIDRATGEETGLLNPPSIEVFLHENAFLEKATSSISIYPATGCYSNCEFCFLQFSADVRISKEFKDQIISNQIISKVAKEYFDLIGYNTSEGEVAIMGGEPFLFTEAMLHIMRIFLEENKGKLKKILFSFVTSGIVSFENLELFYNEIQFFKRSFSEFYLSIAITINIQHLPINERKSNLRRSFSNDYKNSNLVILKDLVKRLTKIVDSIRFKAIITRQNQDRLSEFLDIASEFNCYLEFIPVFFPANRKDLEYLLPDYKKLINDIETLQLERYFRSYYNKALVSSPLVCNYKLYVNPDGTYGTCPMAGFTLSKNVKTLSQVFDHLFELSKQHYFIKNCENTRCFFYFKCHQCFTKGVDRLKCQDYPLRTYFYTKYLKEWINTQKRLN